MCPEDPARDILFGVCSEAQSHVFTWNTSISTMRVAFKASGQQQLAGRCPSKASRRAAAIRVVCSAQPVDVSRREALLGGAAGAPSPPRVSHAGSKPDHSCIRRWHGVTAAVRGNPHPLHPAAHMHARMRCSLHLHAGRSSMRRRCDGTTLAHATAGAAALLASASHLLLATPSAQAAGPVTYMPVEQLGLLQRRAQLTAFQVRRRLVGGWCLTDGGGVVGPFKGYGCMFAGQPAHMALSSTWGA